MFFGIIRFTNLGIIIDSGVATKNAIDQAFSQAFINTSLNPMFTKLRINDMQNVNINIVSNLLINSCFLFTNFILLHNCSIHLPIYLKLIIQ